MAEMRALHSSQHTYDPSAMYVSFSFHVAIIIKFRERILLPKFD